MKLRNKSIAKIGKSIKGRIEEIEMGCSSREMSCAMCSHTDGDMVSEYVMRVLLSRSAENIGGMPMNIIHAFSHFSVSSHVHWPKHFDHFPIDTAVAIGSKEAKNYAEEKWGNNSTPA